MHREIIVLMLAMVIVLDRLNLPEKMNETMNLLEFYISTFMKTNDDIALIAKKHITEFREKYSLMLVEMGELR